MKTASLSVLILLTVQSLTAQPPPADTTLEVKAQRKIGNYNFLQQTLTYSPLSHASPPGCDRGSPKGWYIISADIIPQFVLGGAWTRFTAHLTARYKVRIFRNSSAAGDSSLPVRTPSFMPG